MTWNSESEGSDSAPEVPDRAPSWLVGVDGSSSARHAARWALRHASGRTDHLLVVAAWELPSAPALPPIGPMRKYWDAAAFERDAREALDELADELRAGLGDGAEEPVASVQIETRLVEGPASGVLLDLSRTASLLVVGARGRGGFARLVLGSTSTQCAAHAHVPTVVVPDDAPIDRMSRVVVAVDGSDNSVAAMCWALGFAAATPVPSSSASRCGRCRRRPHRWTRRPIPTPTARSGSRR